MRDNRILPSPLLGAIQVGQCIVYCVVLTCLLCVPFTVIVFPVIISFLVDTHTQYAGGFSVDAFKAIKEGMPTDIVQERLGPPIEAFQVLHPTWEYYDALGMRLLVDDVGNILHHESTSSEPAELEAAKSMSIVLDRYGRPDRIQLAYDHEAWYYSQPEGGFGASSFWAYVVIVDKESEKVVRTESFWSSD